MHIRKLGTGYRVIVQHRGMRRSATARTKSEAQRKGAEMLVGLGDVRPTERVTVGELLTAWLYQTEADHKPTYHLDVCRVWAKVPETFTMRPVADVGPLVVDLLYRQLAKDGWTPHRLQRLHRTLAAAWTKIAIPYGYTTSNPMAIARPPACAPSKAGAPDMVQVRTLLAAATGTIRLYLELAARTGARRGELCALQWPDVGIAQLSIKRSIADLPGRRSVVGDTKTGQKGHRVLALDATCVELLVAHHARQTELAAKSNLPAPLWVFSTNAGMTPWRTDYISREFARLCDRCGVDGVRLHDLRHFVATQMLAGGVPLQTVAGRLGHTQISTTSDTYGSFVPAADRAAADLLDARLLGG